MQTAPIQLIFLVLAFLLFLAKGFGVSYGRADFGWLGLASLTLALWLKV
jgi:hypothetical protein